MAKFTKGTFQPEGFSKQTNARTFTFCSKTGEATAGGSNTWPTAISEVRKKVKTATFCILCSKRAE